VKQKKKKKNPRRKRSQKGGIWAFKEEKRFRSGKRSFPLRGFDFLAGGARLAWGACLADRRVGRLPVNVCWFYQATAAKYTSEKEEAEKREAERQLQLGHRQLADHRRASSIGEKRSEGGEVIRDLSRGERKKGGKEGLNFCGYLQKRGASRKCRGSVARFREGGDRYWLERGDRSNKTKPTP